MRWMKISPRFSLVDFFQNRHGIETVIETLQSNSLDLSLLRVLFIQRKLHFCSQYILIFHQTVGQKQNTRIHWRVRIKTNAINL